MTREAPPPDPKYVNLFVIVGFEGKGAWKPSLSQNVGTVKDGFLCVFLNFNKNGASAVRFHRLSGQLHFLILQDSCINTEYYKI